MTLWRWTQAARAWAVEATGDSREDLLAQAYAVSEARAVLAECAWAVVEGPGLPWVGRTIGYWCAGV